VSSNFREELNKILTIFILYCSTLGNAHASKRSTKTVTVEDIFYVLNEVGLDKIVEDV
jgi:hypothetical protein